MVYSLEKKKENLVAKAIKIKQRNLESELHAIYKEYFLCVLADALEVGPKMAKVFGYDIVITKNYAFFTMEKCDVNVRCHV